MENPKILFISRAYLPVLGGIERQNAGLAESLTKLTTTKIIANGRGKKFLPFFLPWVVLRSLLILWKYDVVLFGDGVLTPIGVFLHFFYRKKKFTSVIHGLDITYAYKSSLMAKIYKRVNIPCHKKMDKLFMVGNETIIQAEKIGIPREKCVFIPNGLEMDEITGNYTRENLAKLLGMDITDKKIIFRGGRIVKHKGTEWFIRNVMPKLPDNYILVVAGGIVGNKTAGDENNYPNCLEAVRELGLSQRVKFFPNIPRPDMKILFNACDLYISPNIKVPGSMEGFGINAIEGAICSRVVLASDLEGLKDAIENNINGFLIPPGDINAWIDKTKELLENDSFRIEFGRKAQEYVRNNFTWENISQRYLDEINKVITKQK